MDQRPKSWIMIVLLALLIFEGVWLFREQPEAEPVYPAKGIITADPSCNMRRDPNTSREVLRELRKDVIVEVLGEVEGEAVGDNLTWYEIRYGEIEGYVSSSFVRLETRIIPPVSMNLPGEAEFQADLKAKGFPEDYVQALMELHRAHPAWKFTPLFTNYSFQTAVLGEYRPGMNLVTATAPPEYKSRADSDFNYLENTWHQYEPGWVGASEALIAFQMDPRNFLNEIQIFQFENQAFNPDIDFASGLAGIISGTFMDQEPLRYINTEGNEVTLEQSYISMLVEAGRLSGVSPYHLASRILQEVSPQGSVSVTGNGYADLIGYYNFYNIGATGGPDPAYMGLVTARDGIAGETEARNAELLFPWDNPYSAIAGGAIFLGRDYINLDQNTLYLQKFNLLSRYTRPFTHQYMGNVLAPEYEAVDVFKSYQQMGTLDEEKEFILPVFTSMPAQTPSPTGGGNPNNWLSSISVNGEALPDFRSERYEYKLDISSANKGIAVYAKAWNPDAVIYGEGIYKLKSGRNEIILQVQSPSGEMRNYRLSVYQNEDTAALNPEGLPKLKDGSYQLSPLGYLYGADPGSGKNQSQEILGSFTMPPNYELEMVDIQGRKTEGAVGTGASLRMNMNGHPVNEFPLVILGDSNGDGLIDILDLNVIYSRVLKNSLAQGTAFDLAMDVNQDGVVDILDLNILYGFLNGGAAISQTFVN